MNSLKYNSGNPKVSKGGNVGTGQDLLLFVRLDFNIS